MYCIPSPQNFDKYDEERLHMEQLLKAHLIEFDLSIRILCTLEKAGIKTLGDLVKQSKVNLYNIRQLGSKSIETLDKLLIHIGLSFAE